MPPAPAVALIPARLASSRLPGKMLLAQTGKPVIVHVLEQVKRCRGLVRVVVCADDESICAAVHAHGGEAILTSVDHPNGTSRLAEAADLLNLAPDTVVVNVQGDEPEIEPEVVERLVAEMLAHPAVPMGTVATPFPAGDSPLDPNIVKVVVSQHKRALYFSRAPIPWNRDAAAPGACQKHMGLYAYRRHFLPLYAAMAPTPLEQAEKLEQLRVLENGHPIAVITAQAAPAGIDTQEQYEAFARRWRARSA